MQRFKTLITIGFKNFLKKRFGTTPEELEELQEIETIANKLFDDLKYRS